jgi:hypothetical protein
MDPMKDADVAERSVERTRGVEVGGTLRAAIGPLDLTRASAAQHTGGLLTWTATSQPQKTRYQQQPYLSPLAQPSTEYSDLVLQQYPHTLPPPTATPARHSLCPASPTALYA